MILDSFGQEPPVSDRRRDSVEVTCNWKDRLGNGGGDRSKVLRRKRMELRRGRSVCGEDLLVRDNNLKKRRSEVKKAAKIIEGELVVELPKNGGGGGRSGVPPGRSHGAASSIGRRREMEDAVAVELDFMRRGGRRYDFFGVYDGHGGRRVAQACGEMLHKVLVGAAGEEAGDEVDWPKVMAAGFKRMDEQVNTIGGTSVATVGTTAVVAVVGEQEVVVANCGDSRAVLSRGGVAVQLSDDHKPDRPDELERIEGCGGRVINWNGQRVMGVLATSRSIGDDYLKPFVSSEPEVTVTARTETDEFLILASDGLWDVVSNDLACQVVRKCLHGQIATLPNGEAVDSWAHAAALLTELAMARGSQDNITAVVVRLDSFSG